MVAYDMCSLVDEVAKPIDSYGKEKMLNVRSKHILSIQQGIGLLFK